MAHDPGHDERVEELRRLWSDGDYRRIAQLFAPVSERLAAELDVAGLRVLDAACGTGNTAIVMAHAGAEVAAFDLTPQMLDWARQRAAAEHAAVLFREGELTAIPWPDAEFELVVSTFGAFLADDAAGCAAELVRVCRPGGRIVTTAWTGEGVIGSWRRAVETRHPEFALQDPSRVDRDAWSAPERVRALFDGDDLEVRVEEREIWFPFASSVEALDTFEATSGPIMRLRDAVLGAGHDWVRIRRDLVAEWDRMAAPTDGGIELPATYAVAVIDRAG